MQVADTCEIDENQEDFVASSQQMETNQSNADTDNTKFKNPKEGNGLDDKLPLIVTSQIKSSDDQNGIRKSTKRGRKAREKVRREPIEEQRDPVDRMDADLIISSKVIQEQTWDHKHKSSNLGKTSSKRGKRVCFNTSTNPTPQTGCTVSDILVLNNGEVKMAKNSDNSSSKQENEKYAPQEIGGKGQRRRSRKQKLNDVQDLAEELSSMQNKTKEFAGSVSSILTPVIDNNGMASNNRQSKSNYSRKSMSCNREFRNTKKLKLSSECLTKTKNGGEIPPNGSLQQCPDVKALNDTSKEKHCAIMDEPVLQKCESCVNKYQCAFCLSSEESEVNMIACLSCHYYK